MKKTTPAKPATAVKPTRSAPARATPEHTALKRALKRLAKAQEAVMGAAQAYARAETIAYSRRHPKREVRFCCAMGTTTLHVEAKGLAAGQSSYMINVDGGYTGAEQRLPIPAFLNVLDAAESETGIPTLAGPLNITCQGGAVQRDLTEW